MQITIEIPDKIVEQLQAKWPLNREVSAIRNPKWDANNWVRFLNEYVSLKMENCRAVEEREG